MVSDAKGSFATWGLCSGPSSVSASMKAWRKPSEEGCRTKELRTLVRTPRLAASLSLLTGGFLLSLLFVHVGSCLSHRLVRTHRDTVASFFLFFSRAVRDCVLVAPACVVVIFDTGICRTNPDDFTSTVTPLFHPHPFLLFLSEMTWGLRCYDRSSSCLVPAWDQGST